MSLKVSREEMLRLLGAEPAKPVASAAPLSPPEARSLFTPAHSLLGGALPRLWRFAQSQPEARDVRLLHRKLRELLAWAAEKKGYRVLQNFPMPYAHDGEHVEGRLELALEREGSPLLAVETDWFGERSSLLKLEAAHRRGMAALWIVGKKCAPQDMSTLRALANRTLRQASGQWLVIYHLEHGWVRARQAPG